MLIQDLKNGPQKRVERRNILIHKYLLLNPRQSLYERAEHLSEVLTIFIYVQLSRNQKSESFLSSAVITLLSLPEKHTPESRNTENRTQKHINGIVKNIEINNSLRFLRQSLFSSKEINVSGFRGLESGGRGGNVIENCWNTFKLN